MRMPFSRNKEKYGDATGRGNPFSGMNILQLTESVLSDINDIGDIGFVTSEVLISRDEESRILAEPRVQIIKSHCRWV